MAVAETGTEVPNYLRHEVGLQGHESLGPANSPSVGDMVDHIRLCLYHLAVGSHPVLKWDPCQGCSGRCAWIGKTLDVGDPVAVRERVVLVVFRQV